MKTFATLALASVAVFAFANVGAHPRDYVNITGDQYIFCHPELTFDQGGSCFDGGHVTANGLGFGSVSINDLVNNPASGFWCQDVDNDGSCDDATEEIFCASLVFQSGSKWQPSLPLYIFGDGPVFGNPVLSVCGQTSIATVGNVSHS